MLFVIVCDTTFADAANTISDYRKYAYARALSSGNPAVIKVGAKGVEYDGYHDHDLADIAAEVLVENQSGTLLLENDTVAWLTKALGATHSKRYQKVLERSASSPEGKIASYAKRNLAQLTVDAEAFEPGVLYLPGIKRALIQTAELSSQPSDASLYDFQQGAWLEDVLAKMGYPSDVVVVFHSVRRPYVGRISYTNLGLVFGKAGTVEFSRADGDWYAAVISPRFRSVSEPPPSDPVESHAAE